MAETKKEKSHKTKKDFEEESPDQVKCVKMQTKLAKELRKVEKLKVKYVKQTKKAIKHKNQRLH